MRDDDWQHELIPRRIKFTEEGKTGLSEIKQKISRGDEIFRGIEDFLKDCAHKGLKVYGSVYETQARIPKSNRRISCQYTFDSSEVRITDIWLEDIE